MREQQSANAVLMVRPTVFHSNPHTAPTNLLQSQAQACAEDLHAACREFDGVVTSLTDAGVNVVTMDAPVGPQVPDAIFPNNWLSTHSDGTAVIYPMLALNRRLERQPALLKVLERQHGFTVRRIIDLSSLEQQGEYVEGTGSVVFDRVNRIAYAALSPRSSSIAIRRLCVALGYRECQFIATHQSGAAIYHTNVMLSIGAKLAIGCFESIRNEHQRRHVIAQLEASGRVLLHIDESQMHEFAANILELQSKKGPLLALSTRAWQSFKREQKQVIEQQLTVCPMSADTIERVGGGGVRCMLAEIHLPVRHAVESLRVAGERA